MTEDNVKVNSLRAWVLAARPKTLTAAAVPVMIGVALHAVGGQWSADTLPAILCFLFAFVLQIDANLVNDYFDFAKGTDDEHRLGPKRACAQGWVTLPAMRLAIGLTTVVGCAVGLPLVLYGGWEMVGIGVLCVLFCFLYTTCLSYMGLGDVLVLVFFGLVPVCATCYVTASAGVDRFLGIGVILAVACGLVVDTLLVVNNYRDIDNDRRTGKRTLIVRIGHDAAEWLYLGLGYVACVMNAVVLLGVGCGWITLLLLIYVALHTQTYRKMKRISVGEGLNAVLGLTARNIFIYGLLVSVCLLSLCWLK